MDGDFEHTVGYQGSYNCPETQMLQMQTLVNYMAENQEFSRGEVIEGSTMSIEEQWIELALVLNSLGPPMRPVAEWKKKWANYVQTEILQAGDVPFPVQPPMEVDGRCMSSDSCGQSPIETPPICGKPTAVIIPIMQQQIIPIMQQQDVQHFHTTQEVSSQQHQQQHEGKQNPNYLQNKIFQIGAVPFPAQPLMEVDGGSFLSKVAAPNGRVFVMQPNFAKSCMSSDCCCQRRIETPPSFGKATAMMIPIMQQQIIPIMQQQIIPIMQQQFIPIMQQQYIQHSHATKEVSSQQQKQQHKDKQHPILYTEIMEKVHRHHQANGTQPQDHVFINVSSSGIEVSSQAKKNVKEKTNCTAKEEANAPQIMTDAAMRIADAEDIKAEAAKRSADAAEAQVEILQRVEGLIKDFISNKLKTNRSTV